MTVQAATQLNLVCDDKKRDQRPMEKIELLVGQ